MIRELTPCLTSSEVALLVLSHQSRKEFSEGCGDKAWRPTCLSKRNQNSLAKTQPTRRWLMVSSSWSQSGQHSGRGSPRRASRSAVQHLLCATSHMKSRHLGGAQDFQIFSHGAKRVEPKKKPSYCVCCPHRQWLGKQGSARRRQARSLDNYRKNENCHRSNEVPHDLLCLA